jgi:hypothetical protein
MYLSEGDRPVKTPVSTEKQPPCAVTIPSLFSISCARSSGYERLRWTTDGPEIPSTSSPTAAQAPLLKQRRPGVHGEAGEDDRWW